MVAYALYKQLQSHTPYTYALVDFKYKLKLIILRLSESGSESDKLPIWCVRQK
jgi:hypothetical protein